MGSGCSSNRAVAVVPGDEPPVPASDPGSPWIQWADDDDVAYYYNFRTGSYTHEEKPCDWYQYCDEAGNVYWANHVTGETRWTGPCQPPALPLLFQAMHDVLERYVPVNNSSNAVVGVPVAHPSATGAVGTADNPVAMAVPVAA